MKARLTRRAGPWTLPFALGLSDGILNALVLASAKFIHNRSDVTVALAMRVGCVAFVTAMFTMFFADYAEQRVRLARATHQLSLSRSGHLASTGLRRRVMRKSAQAAVIASVCSFIGATGPLIVSGATRGTPWSGLVVALVLLGVLGAVLATSFDGKWQYWVGALLVAGSAVTAIGSWLNIA